MGFGELKGDLWELAKVFEAHAVVVTTNGAVRSDGACVMGRGCAKEAKDMFEGIDKRLGALIRENGNRVQIVQDLPTRVIAYPVKHHWEDDADLELIRRSAQQLMEIIKEKKWTKVLMPRPGCGNGRLDWETQVKPILEEELDSRVAVITHAPPFRGKRA